MTFSIASGIRFLNNPLARLITIRDGRRLTLHVRHTLLENLIKHSRVVKLLLDLPDDGSRELSLLAVLHLPFVSSPGVEYGLGLSGNGSFLLELVGLGFELGSLL